MTTPHLTTDSSCETLKRLLQGVRNPWWKGLNSALLVATALVATPAEAATFSLSRSGTWGSSTTWTGGVVPGNSGTDLVQGQATASGIEVNLDAATVLIGTLQVSAPASGTGTLTLTGNEDYSGVLSIGAVKVASGATVVFAEPLTVYTPNLKLNADGGLGRIEFNGTLADPLDADQIPLADGSLTVAGGVVAFKGTSTYAGATNLEAGKLVVGGVDGLGFSSVLNLKGGTLTADPYLNATDSSGRDLVTAVSVLGNVQIGEAGADSLNLSGGLDLGGASRILTVASTVDIAGPITDGGSASGKLVKAGDGKLILSSPNSYTGGTELQAGILLVTAGDALGAAADGGPGGKLTVTGGTFQLGAEQNISALEIKGGSIVADPIADVATVGRLVVKGGSISADVAGTANVSVVLADEPEGARAALVKTGAGTLILSGENEYGGGTTLSAGTLIAGNDKALGTGGVLLAGGVLSTDGVARVLANDVVLSGTVQFGGSGALTFSGTFSLNSASAALNTVTDTVLSGAVKDGTSAPAGGGRLIKEGAAKLTLSAASSYTGGTELRSGKLVAAANGALGSGSVTVNSGTLDVGATTQTISALTVKGGTITRGSVVNAGRLVVKGGAITADVAGTAGVSAILSDDPSGTRAGLLKTGAGTLTLSGENEYGGGTTLSAGTLIVGSNKALGTGSVLLSGGVLGTDGVARVLSNAVVLSGTVQIAGSNQLSLSGNFALNSASAALNVATDTVLAGEVKDGASAPAGGGRLVKEGGAKLTLSAEGSYTGGTELRSGELVATADGALGSGSVTVNSGTLRVGTTVQNVRGLALKGGVVTGDLGGKFVIQSGTGSFVQADVATSASISAAIDGNAGIRKTGAGDLYVTGLNTYQGDTLIEAGAVRIDAGNNGTSGSVLGARGAGVVVLSGGKLVVNGTGSGSSVSLDKEVRVVTSGQLIAEGAALNIARFSVAQAGVARVSGDITATAVDVSGSLTLAGNSPLRAVTLSAGSGSTFVWDKPTLSGGQGIILSGTAATDISAAKLQFSSAFVAKALAETGSLNSSAVFSGTLVVGNFVTSNGTVTAPSSIVQPEGIVSFKLVSRNEQKAIDLVLERKSFQQFGSGGSGASFVKVLDTLPQEALAPLLAAIPAGADEKTVRDIIRKADGGATFASAASAVPAQALAASASVDTHLDDLSAPGGGSAMSLGVRVGVPANSTVGMSTPTGGEKDRNWMVWTSGYGSWGQTSADAAGNGKSRSSGGGASLGLERQLGDLMAGFLVSVGESVTHGDDPYIRVKSDSWNVGGYGSMNIGAISLDASALWGTSEQDSQRAGIGGAGIATTRYSTQNWQTGIGVAANLAPKDSSWQVSPVARLKYLNSSEDAFAETGTALNVGSSAHNDSHVISKLGLRLAKTAQLSPGVTFGVDGAAYWVHDYNSQGRELSYTLSGQPFTSRTRDRQPDSAQMNLGMQLTFTESVTLRLSGQQDLSEDRKQTTGLFSAAYRF